MIYLPLEKGGSDSFQYASNPMYSKESLEVFIIPVIFVHFLKDEPLMWQCLRRLHWTNNSDESGFLKSALETVKYP